MSMKRTSYKRAKATDKEKSALAGVRRNVQEQIDENLATSTAWGNITGKPTTFVPTDHASDHLPGGGDAIQTASATQPGLLTAADWSTFNAGTSNYRAGSQNVSSGNVDITFSSAFSDTDYFLIVKAYDADGTVGYDGITKYNSKFTVVGLSINATIEYYAVEYK